MSALAEAELVKDFWEQRWAGVSPKPESENEEKDKKSPQNPG